MPFSYKGFGGVSGPLDSPIQISAGETGKWYFPRGTRGDNTGNSYTGKYNTAAIPLSFSRSVTLDGFRLRYFAGADAAAFAAQGADAIMFRGSIYEADENNVPHTKVGEMGYGYYEPGVDDPNGVIGVSSFPTPIDLDANKQYFLHFTAVAVTLAAGVPNTILETDTFNLLSVNVYLIGPNDPMASVGLGDDEFFFNSIGTSSYFLQETIDVTSGAGNALDPYPATLSALGSGVYLGTNPIVVAIRTEDQNA